MTDILAALDTALLYALAAAILFAAAAFVGVLLGFCKRIVI
jgi:hypothetical protein